MAKKTAKTKKPAPKKDPVSKSKQQSDFYKVLIPALGKAAKRKMSSDEVQDWLDNSPIGKAIVKSYTEVHG